MKSIVLPIFVLIRRNPSQFSDYHLGHKSIRRSAKTQEVKVEQVVTGHDETVCKAWHILPEEDTVILREHDTKKRRS